MQCPFDQCLDNDYFVINSNNTTYSAWCNWWTASQTINWTTYYRNKCILRIVWVSWWDIYIASSNSDTTASHWNAFATSCTSLTTTCSQLIWTTNWNAATHCTNLKNTIAPPVWTNWFLPPRDTWWLETIQQNISKIHGIEIWSWYWSSTFCYDSFPCWWMGRSWDNILNYSSSTSDLRVRCIAK